MTVFPVVMLGFAILILAPAATPTAMARALQQQPLNNGPLQPTVIGNTDEGSLSAPAPSWQDFTPRSDGSAGTLTPPFPTSPLAPSSLTNPGFSTTGQGLPETNAVPPSNLSLPAEPVFADSGNGSTTALQPRTEYSVDDAALINRQYREDGIASQLNSIRNPNLRTDQQPGYSQQNLPPIGQQSSGSQPTDWNRPSGVPLQGNNASGNSFSTSVPTQENLPLFRPASFSGSGTQDGNFGNTSGNSGTLSSPGSGLPSPGGFGLNPNAGAAGSNSNSLSGLQNPNSSFPSQQSPLTMGTQGDFARSNGLLPNDRTGASGVSSLGNLQQKQAIVEQINPTVEALPVTENARSGYNTARKPLANADREVLTSTPTGHSENAQGGEGNNGSGSPDSKGPLANSTDQSSESLTSLLFVISVAVNFLLAYLFYDTRRNYRDLADELQDRFFRDTV